MTVGLIGTGDLLPLHAQRVESGGLCTAARRLQVTPGTTGACPRAPPSMPRAPAAPRRLLAVLAACLSFLPVASLTCSFGPPSCYADTPTRPVPYLVAPVPGGAGSHTLALGPGKGSCSYLCAASGFGVMAATAHVNASGFDAAYCYCGLAVDPASRVAPASSCNVPCPGNASQACGGQGFSSVYALDCDGPLPPAPVGPALAPGRQCSQPEAAAWGFCNTSWPLEARVDDLVGRIALVEMGPLLTARSAAPIPRLGLTAFYWGTNALHGVLGAGCRPATGACPTVWPDVVAMATSFNATAWRAMGATTGREMRAYDNLLWSQQGANPGGGLTAWGPTINLIRGACSVRKAAPSGCALRLQAPHPATLSGCRRRTPRRNLHLFLSLTAHLCPTTTTPAAPRRPEMGPRAGELLGRPLSVRRARRSCFRRPAARRGSALPAGRRDAEAPGGVQPGELRGSAGEGPGGGSACGSCGVRERACHAPTVPTPPHTAARRRRTTPPRASRTSSCGRRSTRASAPST